MHFEFKVEWHYYSFLLLPCFKKLSILAWFVTIGLGLMYLSVIFAVVKFCYSKSISDIILLVAVIVEAIIIKYIDFTAFIAIMKLIIIEASIEINLEWKNI